MLQDLFELLHSQGVTPNGLLVLQMLHSGTIYQNYINQGTEETRLGFNGFLIRATAGTPTKLTEKGKLLLQKVEELGAKAPRKKKLQAVPFEDWEPSINQYLNLFPKGMQGTAPIRVSPKSLLERFVWFFAEYPDYDWELVQQATNTYLSKLEASAEGFKYLSTSKYFIKKQDKSGEITSKLADWCHAYLEGTTDSLADQGFAYFPSAVV